MLIFPKCELCLKKSVCAYRKQLDIGVQREMQHTVRVLELNTPFTLFCNIRCTQFLSDQKALEKARDQRPRSCTNCINEYRCDWKAAKDVGYCSKHKFDPN